MTDNTSDSDSGSDLEWLFADDSEDEEEDTVESIQLLIGSGKKIFHSSQNVLLIS